MNVDEMILEEVRRILGGEDAELAVRIYVEYRKKGRKGVVEVVERLLREV